MSEESAVPSCGENWQDKQPIEVFPAEVLYQDRLRQEEQAFQDQ